MRTLAGRALGTAGGLLGAVTTYRLVLLAAAGSASRRRSPAAGRRSRRLLVLIPAHNEERGLPATLEGLNRSDYPAHHVRVIVIADNCTDDTARVAAAAGAEVMVRDDLEQRGKGYALSWALARLGEDGLNAEAVVFLDADCRPSPNLLSAFDDHLEDGAGVAQADYVVANPDDSWTAALRWAAFALVCRIQPLAVDSLGLSCGISGTGFVVARKVLERVPWEAFTLAEDQEYHLRLVAAGERVRFVPDAEVRSLMPTSLEASRDQNLRWEAGRWQLTRTWTPMLLSDGLARRDPVRLHAAVEGLVPPQALLLSGNVLLLVATTAVKTPRVRTLALLNLAGQAVYVLGGVTLARAPRSVYRAMAFAPVLALWKLALHLRIMRGKGPSEWVATRGGPGGSSTLHD